MNGWLAAAILLTALTWVCLIVWLYHLNGRDDGRLDRLEHRLDALEGERIRATLTEEVAALRQRITDQRGAPATFEEVDSDVR